VVVSLPWLQFKDKLLRPCEYLTYNSCLNLVAETLLWDPHGLGPAGNVLRTCPHGSKSLATISESSHQYTIIPPLSGIHIVH
jgi:hypothetical protein